MNNKLKKIFKLSGVILCAILIIVLSIVIYFFRKEPPLIDSEIRDFFYYIRGDKYGFIYWLFRILTEFGSYLVIGVILITLAAKTKLDFRFLTLLFGIMLSLIINSGMKDIYSRIRPVEELRWVSEESTSFPSGHSTAAGFFYSFIIYLTYNSKLKTSYKRIIYSLCLFLIPAVMISRMILGVHYFTDVVAGCASGIMVSCLCMLIYRYCDNNDILKSGLIVNKKEDNIE